VYEDERTLAFLDGAPANRGHVLVIPNSHCETLTDMDGPLVGSVFQTVRRVASAVESAYEPAGLNIVQSNGAVAGQEVHHAHVHIIPRFDGDEVTLRWSSEDVSDASQGTTAATLRNEL
jgi:histidine triad (HIT) family protein